MKFVLTVDIEGVRKSKLTYFKNGDAHISMIDGDVNDLLLAVEHLHTTLANKLTKIEGTERSYK